MAILQRVSLIVWLVGSFLIARFLHKKYPLFKKIKGVFLLFTVFFVLSILHNLVYGLFKSYFDAQNSDEGFFFVLSFFSLGAAIFLLIIQVARKLKG